MFELKVLSPSGIEAAIEKIERYRLLNEPADAESICRDVLAIDSDNQQALVNLVLTLSDQFVDGLQDRYDDAVEAIAQLHGEYDREYYTGLICERRAKTALRGSVPGSGSIVYEWLRRAMDSYERADALSSDDNEDAKLRWNTCARIIMTNRNVKPEEETVAPIDLE